jgi:type II secretory pathway pseudopilin PulG
MLFRRKPMASRANAGFVLIEVLVAVGVAAALMAVLIRSFSQTWSGVNIVREEAEGTLLARSMMAAALQRDKLVAGSQEGTAGRYAWKMTTAVMAVPTVASQPKQPQQQQQQQQGVAQLGQQQQQQQGASQSNQQPQQNADNQVPKVLYHLALVLVGPSGRSNRLDSYEIGQPPQ